MAKKKKPVVMIIDSREKDQELIGYLEKFGAHLHKDTFEIGHSRHGERIMRRIFRTQTDAIDEEEKHSRHADFRVNVNHPDCLDPSVPCRVAMRSKPGENVFRISSSADMPSSVFVSQL